MGRLQNSVNNNAIILMKKLLLQFLLVSMAMLVQGAQQTITIPANGETFVGCQINGTGGNNIDNPSFLQVSASFPGDGEVSMFVWECTHFVVYYYYNSANAAPASAGWYDPSGNPANVVWNPGEGMILEDSSASSGSITLNGTVPIPVLPPANYCGCGQWSFLSSQTNSATSTYQQDTGFAPVSGSEVAFTYSNGPTASDLYLNGSWTPATPILTNGQAAFFFVPCETNECLTVLSTDLVAYVPCGSNCLTIPLSATAVDTCCSNVSFQYYLGSTFIPATNTCFSAGTTNTIEVVATDACGHSASNTFNVIVLPNTNCGCCGPGQGTQTIQWLEGSLSTGSMNDVVLSATTCGSWLVTNLPCYGRVLITETFPGNVTDFNNPGFENVPNGSGTFVNMEPGYGPYNWGDCPGLNFVNTFSSGQTFAQNLDWTLNFYFLDGPPSACNLYLDASALAQYTLATVSQPVVFRGEYDLPTSAHTCITNNYYDPYIFLTGVTNAGKVGTVIGSYYNGDHVGDNSNTGWALFQPTAALQTTTLPQGAFASCPGYPAPATVSCLSLNISQEAADSIGFMIGYVCCPNMTTNCIHLDSPGDIILTTCSNCVTANFSASATDLCCSNVAIGYELNGILIDTNYCFPVNSTNAIEVMAADGCGNIATNMFEVTVLPGASCGSNGCITILSTNLFIDAPCSTNCVVVPLSATAIDTCCTNDMTLQYYLGGTSISATDTCFSVNTTNTVEVVAMDGCSNTASSYFTVTVIQDSNPPVILSCPTNITICTGSGASPGGGPIIVDSDELVLSDTGFSQEGYGALYATNCAAYLTRGLGTNILIYSSNSGLNGSSLFYSLKYAGYNVTENPPPTPPLTLSYLSGFNAVFVGGDPLTTNEIMALEEYVCNGGGVYVAAGTGDIPTSNGNTPAQAEAAQWNLFINPFGLNLADTYNGIVNVLTVGGGTLTANSSPVMAGVEAIDYSIGNDVSVIGGDPLAQVIAYSGSEGIIAVSGCVSTASNGCGQMPDETGLVITSGGGTVTQSIPPGTTICNDTNVTFTVSNLCGEVAQTNIPCVLVNCASNECITITCSNLTAYVPCGSNCVIVPLTATAMDTCCTNIVSFQFYLGGIAISAADTCFSAGTTNLVEVVGIDGCGHAATNTFEVTVLPQTANFAVLSTNLLVYAPCGSNCMTVPLTATVIDPCCGNNVSVQYYEGATAISSTNTCFPVNSTTPVTVVAMDGCGNGGTNTFNVTVLPQPTYVSVLSSNVFVYAPCGSNCLTVPLTATTTGYCCSGNVTLRYYEGSTSISATDTCFPVDSATPVTVVATDGCGDAATNTFDVTVLPSAPCTNGCIRILSTNLTVLAPCGDSCVAVPLTARAIDTCCSNVILQYYLGATSISATNNCFTVGTTTVEVVAMDSCGNTASSIFEVTVLSGTNCCCGPGLGPRTIQWLSLPLSTNFTVSVDLNNSTCGSWLVTNLPCYGRVLITETAPGNLTDFNNQGFQNVPNPLGIFINTDTNYGPYDWGYCPALNFVNTFSSGQNNLAWTLNFYFLDGTPNPCTLYLEANGLGQYTTATVSQPVVYRGEYDLAGSAHTCISNATYNPYPQQAGVTNAGTVGTVIGSYYNSDSYGDDLNTGLGLFQPTGPLPTTSLPQGAYASCPGYPAAATVPYLSLNISQQPGDGIGFNVGYVCCGTTCLNLQCPGSMVLTTCSNCATANFSASATDLCCSNVQITYELNGSVIDTNYCFPVNSTNTVETLAADSCGNVSSCSFTVTVLPGTNCLPCFQFNCPTNMTVQCGTLWTSTPPTIVHSCCPSNSIFRLSSVTNGTCPKFITDTWQVSDSCGDMDICTQMITVIDTTPPVITGGTNPVTGTITTNCQLVIPPISVTATDSCTPLCSLGQWQSPAAGVIVPGPNAYVTVTVTDLCGNASQCQVLVQGVYKRGLVVNWPAQIISSNCLVPCVGTNLAIQDCSCSPDTIRITQSPQCDMPIGPGQHSITITVTDCHGLTSQKKIPLLVMEGSFLNVLTNTGIAANGSLLPGCAVDPHYTLGPVPATSPVNCILQGYNRPEALAVNNLWPTMETKMVSEWISPNCNPAQMWESPYGFYTYTNHFVLPQGDDASSASIVGRWTADDGAVAMMFNGKATGNKINSSVPGFYWTTFTINGNFLPYPQVNTVLFVVTNNQQIAGCTPTGLRVEYLEANICSTCAPPAIVSMTTPPQPSQAGSTATFNVQADGTPPLNYQWTFNGKSISGATGTSLELRNITASSAGIYTVIVSDPCGSVTNSARLSVTPSLVWMNGWWTFDTLTNPQTATFGPDLSINGVGTGTNLSLAMGTTEDFGLPNPGGQIVNVLGISPLWPATITLPPILPAGSASDANYTVIMDIYQPDTSQGTPSTLFESAGDGSGIGLTLDASNYLDITGTSGGTPFDVPSTTPMTADTWHRIALVVTGPVAGIGGSINGYLDGEPFNTEPVYPFNCPCCNLNINSGIYYTNSPVILSGTNGATTGNGEIYVSSLQFHATALPSQIIAALGAPDSGPVADVSNVTPPPSAPALSATTANGSVNFTWSSGGYVLQETADLTSDEWTDSELPFTETEITGGASVMTTAVATPTPGAPAMFYRLVFRP
jgi:hypothetical protein